MWIAKDKDLIVVVADSKEELKNKLVCMVYDTIEETKENYILYNGSYISEPEYLEFCKTNKITLLKQLRDEAEIADITTDKGTFDYDSKSKERISLAISQMSNTDELDWTLADNSSVKVKKHDLQKVVDYVAYRTVKLHAIYSQYKEMVANAKTIEEVEAVPTDYPTELSDEEKIALVQKHLQSLSCTKLQLMTILEKVGITYESLKMILCKVGEQAQMQWETCSELLRGNSLLDNIGTLFGFTPNLIDGIFLYVNGEMTEEEFDQLLEKINEQRG